MAKKQQRIKREKLGPMVYGNGLEGLILTCYERGDIDGLLKILPDMPCRHVLAVCQKRARIEGDDVKGFRISYYENEREEVGV